MQSAQPIEETALPLGHGEAQPLLEMEGIVKTFPGVRALGGVDFTVLHGEVHVLFGENGAGKSTLINIIAGTYPADDGRMQYDGRPIKGLTPHGARLIGISPVFQEFSLAPDLTVEQNLFLGREISRGGIMNKRAMRARARAALSDLGFDLPVGARVGDLMRAQQQMTEIAKALLQDVRLLILDEPSASLTERETEKLFEIIERLKATGVGIIYVSHRMGEIKRVADRITVLRDGRKIATVNAAEVSETQLVEMMTGRPIDVLFPPIAHHPTEIVLEGRDLSTGDGRLAGASFHLRAGEVVGLAGLVGSGKSELGRALFGLETLSSGEITLFGQRIGRPTPASMLGRGLCYFPSDRVAEGLSMPRPVRENASIAALELPAFSRLGLLRRRTERSFAKRIVEQLQVRPPNPEGQVGSLSGGNRQKVMLARGLSRDIRVFLFDEPTIGIDVGAKTEVYQFLKGLVESGSAVLLISSELPEILHLCHRVYVMHRGRLVSELEGGAITEEAILSGFFDRREGEHGESHGARALPGSRNGRA
jgi:ribose transport system ATP-binding protein